MRRFLVALLVAGTVGISDYHVYADADAPSQPFQSSFFSQDSSDSNDFQFSNGGQRPNAERLRIPENTPTPLEGFRWKKKNITIYMETADPKLKWAFRDAVKNGIRRKQFISAGLRTKIRPILLRLMVIQHEIIRETMVLAIQHLNSAQLGRNMTPLRIPCIRQLQLWTLISQIILIKNFEVRLPNMNWDMPLGQPTLQSMSIV